MTYKEKLKLNNLYNRWLPHNYASLIASRVPYSNTSIRNVRHFRAENEAIEKELLMMVNSAKKKNERRKNKLSKYAKR